MADFSAIRVSMVADSSTTVIHHSKLYDFNGSSPRLTVKLADQVSAYSYNSSPFLTHEAIRVGNNDNQLDGAAGDIHNTRRLRIVG